MLMSRVNSAFPATTMPAPPVLMRYGVMVIVTLSFLGFKNTTPLLIVKLLNEFGAVTATGSVRVPWWKISNI